MNIVTTIIIHHEYFWVIIVVTIFIEDDTMTILVHFTITLLIHNIMSARYRESAFLDHHKLTFNQYDYEVLCSTQYHAFVQDLPRFPTGSKQLHFHFGLHPPILNIDQPEPVPGRAKFSRAKNTGLACKIIKPPQLCVEDFIFSESASIEFFSWCELTVG